MRIEQIFSMTSARLTLIGTNATIRMAARCLSDRRVGLAVVCDAKGKAAGVLSKSDLVRYLTLPDTLELSVSALMSERLVSCSPEDDVHDVWQTMAARDLQNVPVLINQSKPVGVLDIRDAMRALVEEEELQEHMLINYIAGIGYR